MWAIQGSEFMFQTQKPAVWVKIGKLFVFFFITDLKRGTPKQMFAVTYAHTQTHLPVENNAPDEPENQFVIPINDVCRSNVHQINLQRHKNLVIALFSKHSNCFPYHPSFLFLSDSIKKGFVKLYQKHLQFIIKSGKGVVLCVSSHTV